MSNIISFRVAMVTVLLLLISGCGYPDVSPKTYECAKALYSICNRQDSERLATVESLIDTARSNDEISATEAGWLQDIIATARQSEWEEAAAEARTLMMDQVRER